MSANILEALTKLAAIKQLDPVAIQEIIVEAVNSTLLKKLTPEAELQVFVDDVSGNIKARFNCLVVEVEEGVGQISLGDARSEYDAKAVLGQYIEKTMSLHEFEPKLVKTAQKIIRIESVTWKMRRFRMILTSKSIPS